MNKSRKTLPEDKTLEMLSLLTTEERNAVLEFAGLLKKRFGSVIKGIILFGSKVRGEGDEESDIDILIILTNLSWAIKKAISELAAEENLKYNVLISTIRYDAATWENPVIRESPFGRSVREEGIWL
jgi:predicted nucleotidyltransferase